MTRKEFDTGMAALFAGFAYAAEKTTHATEDVYFEMLKDIPVDHWMIGVKNTLVNSQFFPSIHDLGVACFGETLEHDEERCDPLRFRQNYTVHIPAVTWQENMRKVMESKPALPPPSQPKAIASPVVPVVKRPYDGRAYLTRIWGLQDDAGMASFNNPDWYTPKPQGWMSKASKRQVDELVEEPPF